MNDLSTKEKILGCAHKLFAEKGLNGVSVREIAKVCDVNISAINYHFENKENLYAETVKMSIREMNNDLHNLFECLIKKDVKEFALRTFRFMTENSEDLRTAFRLILASDHVHADLSEELGDYAGPPGGEYFYKCLKEEFPNAGDEDLDWAVRVLFTQVMHTSMIRCNEGICKSMEDKGLDEKQLELDLERVVTLIKSSLKNT